MRVAVVGAAGQLGTELVAVLGSAGATVLPLTRPQCDITRPGEAARVLADLRPDAVVNAAAYVRVDDAEDHPDAAFAANALGALEVARGAEAVGARCVYVSTDYVFDGRQEAPYSETDPPGPLNVYGASKLAGEHLTRLAASRSLVVRVAGLFGGGGARGKQGNFIQTILRKAVAREAIQVVDDMRVTVTYARHAARAIARLLEEGTGGIVHVTNQGSLTWHDLALHALRCAGLPPTVSPTSRTTFPSRARRPAQSALVSHVTGTFREELPAWQAAVQEYIAAVPAPAPAIP